MFGHRVRVIAPLFAAALSLSCGGEDDGGLAIQLSRQGLGIDVARVRIDVHTGDRKCEGLRDSGPIILGSYKVELDFQGNAPEKGNGEISEIRPNTYTVVVWGFRGPGLGAVNAFGCAENVVIENGKKQRVSLRLIAFP